MLPGKLHPPQHLTGSASTRKSTEPNDMTRVTSCSKLMNILCSHIVTNHETIY